MTRPRGKYWDKEIETMPRKKLEALQLQLLKEEISFAYKNSPYYKMSFDEKRVRPGDLKYLEDIRKFPFTDKKVERDRQLAAPDLGDMLAVAEDEIIYVSASSGSTGVPTLSPFSAQDFDEFQDVEARLFWGIGMRPKDRYLHALNFTLFIGGPDVIGAQRVGALCIWGGAIPSERLLFIMKQFKPTITWTTPSYAWFLGETALKEGIDPAKDLVINKIIVAGEPGGSIKSTRDAIEKLWGAKVYDFYGLSDIFGANAGMCEEQNGLHLTEDHHLLEVLNPDTLEPVPEGERGEMVLTTLKKRARPMIRFRTGDIITVNEEVCRCGRTHARINIHGRIDDMLIITGVNVFPSDIEKVVRDSKELTGEYRVIVYREQHLDKFDVEVEKKEAIDIPDKKLAEEIRRRLKSLLGVSPRIKILKENTIERATHKAKRVIDKREKVWSD
ncbi:MAG: phenylacetate--CoA ligase [Thermodesulfobacteriota bacterium]|nr:phenylacetate--CoA ligase [Thermodesulfobacteriota bacterium]